MMFHDSLIRTRTPFNFIHGLCQIWSIENVQQRDRVNLSLCSLHTRLNWDWNMLQSGYSSYQNSWPLHPHQQPKNLPLPDTTTLSSSAIITLNMIKLLFCIAALNYTLSVSMCFVTWDVCMRTAFHLFCCKWPGNETGNDTLPPQYDKSAYSSIAAL